MSNFNFANRLLSKFFQLKQIDKLRGILELSLTWDKDKIRGFDRMLSNLSFEDTL